MKIQPIDARLNRLVGQIEGIRRMINGGRQSGDVIQQILAARQALSRVGIMVLKEELMKKNGMKNAKATQKLLDKLFGL
ncbi:hypothetical protein A3D08_03005 [Candidatus Roizmanbacteria bacterium RIFCSPHIGHO2_02_FULL_43_11]|uniref:Transcriptional regulator n=1 Tax=Candidatus Roizmanbacteria bacterium RIFCSPHIGHO2_02_FULL_43_11 TaxID=1802043 RepID=A0A1F7HKK3_9BACT|nr:MAG: hypothetical protein A3D08_03005 [Candidatus Roizmanbacteria bacterium RIFCSPHIGHO2_02_FULL_43_11]